MLKAGIKPCEQCRKPFYAAPNGRGKLPRFCSIACTRIANPTKKHGQTYSPTWNSWTNMRERCTNQNRPAYQDYGARGITVCERWNDFANFLAN